MPPRRPQNDAFHHSDPGDRYFPSISTAIREGLAHVDRAIGRKDAERRESAICSSELGR